ncbi:MAG TPA: ATP-binding protein [Verrucomicrobiae bacterium]|nr:ATP-binding protein [Verrucomicrobiae bacterium]
MNTRSLKFQLVGWYALLLIGVFGLLGVSTYLALRSSLTSSLEESQLRRARQIAQLLVEESQEHKLSNVGQEIQARYAPELNDRFVRITRADGALLYLSPTPKSQSFDPAAVPPPQWSPVTESGRQVMLLGGRKMLLAAHKLKTPTGSFLIETGAPMDEVQADSRHWLIFLITMLPIVVAIALGGGYVLVKRALAPVDRIAASAESISSTNLSERLPLAQTGDELERLSLALNHMIERLDAAFEHSRRFVADASHELRTPLTVLRGEIETMVREPQLTDESRERLGSALEEVERLTNIVEGLFAISRLDAGEAAAEWVKFDLALLATSTADQMSLLAEDKRIEVTCAAPSAVWVQGDRARMKQVIVNLLDNAIKYTPEGGAVHLSVGMQNAKAMLEVVDNGPGIPPEVLPRIFERFFRVDQARSRDQGGAGLGLSIVKSICTAHHGRVEASSSPGQGSRFRVELPLVPANSNSKHNHHEHRDSQAKS